MIHGSEGGSGRGISGELAGGPMDPVRRGVTRTPREGSRVNNVGWRDENASLRRERTGGSISGDFCVSKKMTKLR